jgi:hypothetical protein
MFNLRWLFSRHISRQVFQARKGRIMRRIGFGFVLTLGILGLSRAADSGSEEKPVPSKITSVALFKNGLAVIQQHVELKGPGTYRLQDVPEPVHGTFWVESASPIEARVETRESKAQSPRGLGTHLQDELAGLKVTVQGRNAKTPVTGIVLKIPKPDASEAPPIPEGYESYRPYPPAEPASRFLLLKTDRGVSYVELADIASLEAEGQPEAVPQRKAVLLLQAGPDAKPGAAQITYLAHGLSWAPSYRVDASDPKQLTIEQHAVVRNELSDLQDAEFSLISGYPSVQFGHVTSPLAAQQTWQRFFQQLGQRGGTDAFSNAVVAQQAYAMRANAPSPVIAPNTGDSIDLNFHSIGKRSLRRGSALALSTGKGQAGYERIVDWTIPDNRDEWGNPRENRQIDPSSGEPLQDDIWDALKFKNPLPFAMTSAPAMVMAQGKFSGQRQVLWTNRGEEATLRINKALSIRARHVEFEEQKGNGVSERDVIHIGGRRFRRATVNGELRLCNHRSADAKLLIKRHFSGDLVKADGNPKVDLREEGIWTANKRNELNWTLTLKPGEERNLTYQYTVLVNF